jgi:hypothetical protein
MSLRKHKTHHVGFRLTELEHSQLAALAEQQGVSPGECCRTVLQESLRGKTMPILEQTLLEELAALRSIVSTLMFDLVTGSSLTEERMHEIIAHAEECKFERAAHIVRQLLNRHPSALPRTQSQT